MKASLVGNYGGVIQNLKPSQLPEWWVNNPSTLLGFVFGKLRDFQNLQKGIPHTFPTYMPQAHQTVAGLFVPRQILGGIRKETTEGWPKKKDN